MMQLRIGAKLPAIVCVGLVTALRLPVLAAEPIAIEGVFPEPGAVFKDCEACPEMVVVPSGSFVMGVADDAPSKLDHAKPRHEVAIAEPFAIGRYETTFAEYDAFAAAEGRPLPDDFDWGRGSMPVMMVSALDARDYVAWLSEITGETYRLPSEAEWEYAARAGTETRFWFGDEHDLKSANVSEDVGRSVPVGQFPPNQFGLYDIAGNMVEIVADCHHPDYVGAPADGSAWLEDSACDQMMIRDRPYGGTNAYDDLRFRNRPHGLDYVSPKVGFRVVREIELE